MAQQDIITEQ